MMHKIAIVEDNEQIREQLQTLLLREGYEVVVISDFKNVVADVLAQSPHLLLLDINLPYDDGYSICRELRRQTRMPIIIVTSRDTEMDELMSMNIGADDFVTKPYNVNILVARIQNLLKRSYDQDDKVAIGNMVVDLNKALVTCQNRSEELTKNEFRILSYFIKNHGKAVTRDELMTYLWDSDLFVDDNTLTVNVNRLRKKLEAMGAEPKIQTKRGIGYML